MKMGGCTITLTIVIVAYRNKLECFASLNHHPPSIQSVGRQGWKLPEWSPYGSEPKWLAPTLASKYWARVEVTDIGKMLLLIMIR
jgi:hypothetical protein